MSFTVLAAESLGTLKVCLVGGMFSDLISPANFHVLYTMNTVYDNWLLSGGKLLLELNRLLRPGGYFVWSATPVYQKLPEDVEIWNGIVLNTSFNITRTVQQNVAAISMTTYQNSSFPKIFTTVQVAVHLLWYIRTKYFAAS